MSININKKYILAGTLATAFVLPISNVNDSYAAETRTITGRVNFRSGPSTNYKSYMKIQKGTKVTYLGKSGSWVKIKYNSKTGYVHKDYISSSSASTSTSTSKSTKYVTPSAGLNLRKGPSTKYSVIKKLSKGTKVTLVSSSNGWSKVKVGGTTGYVSSSYLSSKKQSTASSSTSSTSSSSTSTSSSKVINYAKKLLGKPYVWGAQGPNGFDCSGFTYYVFKNSAGKTLPRTSSAQSRYGTSVSKKNLKAGDLVFFDTSGPNNGAVTHCGIYIGNNKFIHAASGQGKVVINDLTISYYVKAYVNARRAL